MKACTWRCKQLQTKYTGGGQITSRRATRIYREHACAQTMRLFREATAAPLSSIVSTSDEVCEPPPASLNSSAKCAASADAHGNSPSASSSKTQEPSIAVPTEEDRREECAHVDAGMSERPDESENSLGPEPCPPAISIPTASNQISGTLPHALASAHRSRVLSDIDNKVGSGARCPEP